MAPVFDPTTRRGKERAREVFTGRTPASFSPEEADRSYRAGYEPDGEHLIGRASGDEAGRTPGDGS